MLLIKNEFEIGDKVITISDKDGVFKILEVEIYGIVYQDFEKDKPVKILYVFDLAGERKFGNADILFKSREAAMVKLQEMVPKYQVGYEEEKKSIEQQIKNLEDHKSRLINSALDLINGKTDGQLSGSDTHTEPSDEVQ